MENRVNRENISIVLVEPHIPENIGGVVRAMNNMGLEKLIIVQPKNYDFDRIKKTATIHSQKIIEEMKVYHDVEEALGIFQYIAGTTARIGSMRPAIKNPKTLAEDLVEISQDNSVAILFGPEDRGLSNEHLGYCNTTIKIPTSDFSSLNLAHAVMVICYELFIASQEKTERNVPRLANRFELEGMYGHVKGLLTKIGFLDHQNHERWMLSIRRLCSRFPLRAKEVQTLRGICRQVDWYTDQAAKNKKEEDCGKE
ncbi:RNA methyltransferase [Thermodesulfobacteriota bacterium]